MTTLLMRRGFHWALIDDKVWWHLQNLMDDHRDRVVGSWLRQGRWCLHVWSWTVHAEWSWLKMRGPGIHLDIGQGDADVINVGLQLGIGSVWLGVEHYRLHNWLERKTKRRDAEYGNGRSNHVYWSERALWFDIWADPMEWRTSDPRWMQFSIHFDDLIFGKARYLNEALETQHVIIPMPEKSYDATVTLERATWKRPRWPWARVIYRASIDCPEGIPHPGKGDNSWDCGQGRTFGLTCPAKTISEAIGEMVKSVMRSRERHGHGITDVG